MSDLSFWKVGSMRVLGGRIVLVEGQSRKRPTGHVQEHARSGPSYSPGAGRGFVTWSLIAKPISSACGTARRLARGLALARRALPVSALTESRAGDARGAVMSLDTRRTRHGESVCACRRRDRRTHDEVGGARSARQLARGSARRSLGGRRRCRL